MAPPWLLLCSLLEVWLNVTSTNTNCHHDISCHAMLPDQLLGNFSDVAETEGMQISLHPDDPPWGLLGIVIFISVIILISVKSSNLTMQ